MAFDFEAFKKALTSDAFDWKKHALQRVDQRHLRQDQVVKALLKGEIIEDYPSDYPLPRALVLARIGRMPFHAVVAYDKERDFGYIVTVYLPDLDHFLADHKTRKKRNAQEE